MHVLPPDLQPVAAAVWTEWKPGDVRLTASRMAGEARRLSVLAREARHDAAGMRRLASLERERLAEVWLAERCAGGTGLGGDVSRGERRHRLNRLVDAAIRLSRADMANVQLVDPDSGSLDLEAQFGFFRPFLEHFARVQDPGTACHAALSRGVRIQVPDVTESPIFRGTAALEVMLDAGARAVQSVPLVSRSGRILGVFSMHYRRAGHHGCPDLAALRRLIRRFVELLGGDSILPPSGSSAADAGLHR